jgi:hypothetical protein
MLAAAGAMSCGGMSGILRADPRLCKASKGATGRQPCELINGKRIRSALQESRRSSRRMYPFGFSERPAPAKSWVTGIFRTSAKKATSKSDTHRL